MKEPAAECQSVLHFSWLSSEGPEIVSSQVGVQGLRVTVFKRSLWELIDKLLCWVLSCKSHGQ